MTLKYASIIGFILAFISILTLIDQGSFFASGIIGISVQILAALLLIWARLVFGRRSFHIAANPTEGGLVTAGPYRYLRHPIYAAIIYFIWAGILTHISISNISAGSITTIGLVMRIIAEEELVRQRYSEYTEYAARTKRIVPFIF